MGGGLAAKKTHARAKVTSEGWSLDTNVVSKMCTDFNDVLFETVVKSSCERLGD